MLAVKSRIFILFRVIMSGEVNNDSSFLRIMYNRALKIVENIKKIMMVRFFAVRFPLHWSGPVDRISKNCGIQF